MNGQTVLDKHEHARLIADIDHIAQVAGVSVKYIRQSMMEVCNEAEIEWVINFPRHRKNGVPGLVLEGIKTPDIVCQSMAGALLRNFIDARVMPINHVIDLHQAGRLPTPTCLLVPNLFVQLSDKGLPGWMLHIAYDILLTRASAGKPSVVYIENRDAMQKEYGTVFVNFLDQFEWVKG